MHEKKTAAYGSWKSPITSDLIVAETIRLMSPGFYGGNILWLEMHPKEGGRYVLVEGKPGGKTTELTPQPFNVRSRVHEYGGGAYTVTNGTVYFSNFADQRVYRQGPGSPPRPITPELDLRFADYVVDHRRNLLLCVREDHRGSGEAVNTLVKVKCDGDENGGEIIVSGNDFYSSPRLSPDGTRLAWLTWNHPNMPWDAAELRVGEMDSSGSIIRTELIAGGEEESVFQSQWSPDGVLYFISDRTGWWNLYRWQEGNIEALCPMEAEFGTPQWIFGMSTYAFESPGRIICTYTKRGKYYLASLDTETLKMEEISSSYTYFGNLSAKPGRVLFLAGSPTEALSVVHLDLETRQFDVLRRMSTIQLDPGYVSFPKEIEFPTEEGSIAYAYFYAPQNRDFAAPESEKPPLIVMSHGGPTGATSPVFNPRIQYWTSRGFAVIDVNYRGSTGYGRAYRQSLNGKWGVADVEDCENGALCLVERNKADGERLIIRGGSAGGYTTLCAITFRKRFKAGASYYGIGDLETIAKDTHKFESRYLDKLVGPYPDRRDLYVERSPINFTEQLECPLILFQGSDDKIVLPEQSRKMYTTLKAKGLPVAYLEFENEQHGFRNSENIKRALDAELYFYSKVFGFELADPIKPVSIYNL